MRSMRSFLAPLRQEELLVLKGGGSHDVRELRIIVLAEYCVCSAFATNKTTVFLPVEHMVHSSDEDMKAQGWLLMADFRWQLPF